MQTQIRPSCLSSLVSVGNDVTSFTVYQESKAAFQEVGEWAKVITHTMLLANGVSEAFNHCKYLVDLYVRKVPNPSFYQPKKPKGPR